ncbi:MAG: hypothetical protein QOD93_7080 [Acetobacteraceae bacterium]|nr:hypothetical protein [Acetobacteraceae bacterium]
MAAPPYLKRIIPGWRSRTDQRRYTGTVETSRMNRAPAARMRDAERMPRMRPPFTTRPTWPSAMPDTSIGRGKGASIGRPGCWPRRRYRQSVRISSAPACREVPCDPCGARGRRQTRPAPISAALAAPFSRTKKHHDIESVTRRRPSTHKSEPRFRGDRQPPPRTAHPAFSATRRRPASASQTAKMSRFGRARPS